MSNSETAVAGLIALENEAIAAHKRVAEYLEGIRVLFDSAIILRHGQIYRIAGLRAHRGIVKVYGVRCYGKYHHKIGTRQYDLGDFRECKILQLHKEGDAQPKVHFWIKPDIQWHPKHNGPALGETTFKA